MRSTGFMAIAIGGTALIGFIVCRVLHVDAHVREMVIGALGVAAVGVVAGLPMLLCRGAGQMTVAQAGLKGSVIHLLGCVMVAMLALFKGVINSNALLFWVVGFYLTSLVAMTVWMVLQIRLAPSGEGRRA